MSIKADIIRLLT